MEDLEELNRRWGELLRKRNRTAEENEEKETVGALLEMALRKEADPLIAGLRSVGVYVNSAWDLVNGPNDYTQAIPILVEHLSKPYHHRNKEGIVRALAVKEAKGVACKAIIEEYLKVPKEKHSYRWTFGNTMRAIITKECTSPVTDIVLDETNGDSRQMFVRALSKIKSEEVKKVLEKLRNDKSDIIRKEAEKALKKNS